MKRIVQQLALAALVFAALLGGISCASIKPLPPADLSQPGWQVSSGQAVWSPGGGRAEITGDLVFAANRNGDFFVQFLKTPLPIVTAESIHGSWQIEFGANKHHWQGPGRPPQRFSWFQLPAVLAHRPPTGNWRAAMASTNMFTLKNSSTGESLEGQFFP